MDEYIIYTVPESSGVSDGTKIAGRLRELFNQFKKTDPEKAEKFRRAANFASNLPKHDSFGLTTNERRKRNDPGALKNCSRYYSRKVIYSFTV